MLACSSILPQLENIARIALAIDYNGNGYRSLLPMAVKEPAVLNAALAVAASHHSRWQRKPDTVSRKYLRAASKALRERFLSPNSIHDPVTLASMLLLVSFEVCLYRFIFGTLPRSFRILLNRLVTRFFRARVGGKDTTMQSVAGSDLGATAPTSNHF